MAKQPPMPVGARPLVALWRLECVPFLIAGRLVARGFRLTAVRGFTYDRGGLVSPVLIALAITTVPQGAVLDMLFSHEPIARAFSAVLHAYAVAWSLALADDVRRNPHVIDERFATFAFPLLARVRVPLEDVVAADVVTARPRRVPRFGLGRTGVVVHVRSPATIDTPLGCRRSAILFVAADEPHRLAAALLPRAT